MPTRYQRIGVVVDPELDDALRLAAPRLRAASRAARVRELALIGARSLGAGDEALDQLDRELDELGATRARGDLVETSRRVRKRVRGRPEETISESLEWVRGDR
jgi:hypothetical protein